MKNTKVKNAMNTLEFEYFYSRLKTGNLIDETCFYFADDSKEEEHYIGYIREAEQPYWIGLCDVPNGMCFNTAEELIDAPVFDGQSLKSRWSMVRIASIEGLSLDDWIESTGGKRYSDCWK